MQVSCQTTVLSVFSVLFDVGFSRMHISHHHSFSWLLILEISCIHDVASTIQTVQLFKGNYLLSFLIKESIINSPLPSSSFLCLFHSSTLPSPPLPFSPFLSLSLLSALSLSLSALPSMYPSLYSPPLPHIQWVPHSYTTFHPHTPTKLTKQPCPEVVTHTHSFIQTLTIIIISPSSPTFFLTSQSARRHHCTDFKFLWKLLRNLRVSYFLIKSLEAPSSRRGQCLTVDCARCVWTASPSCSLSFLVLWNGPLE